ncbi:MAG TPA: hypothetical protein VF735_14170 [Pyrinomonadaceae bacterium]|jgi:hypothetical protein
MTLQVIDEASLRRYLLGLLASDEQQQVEERLLIEDQYFERLLVIEDELIDQYLSDELSRQEREKFNQIFLSTPERYEKLRFAKDLKSYLAAATPAAQPSAVVTESTRANSVWDAFLAFWQRPVVGFSLALMFLLTAFGSGWLLIKMRRLETHVGQLEAQQMSPQSRDLQQQLTQQRARTEELAAELQRAQQQRTELYQEITNLKAQQERRPEIATNERRTSSRSSVVSLFLPLFQSRGIEQTQALDLPPQATQARLILDLGTIPARDYKGFQATVQEVNGSVIWTGNNLKNIVHPGANQVILTLPASRLSSKDYLVKLNGLTRSGGYETIGVYTFRVHPR